MKRKSLIIIIAMFLIGPIATTGSLAQAPLSFDLLFDKSIYYPDDPIQIVMTLWNNSGSDVITSKGFSDKPFHLYLDFTGPDGKVITSVLLTDKTMPTPKTPPVFIINDQLIQGDPIEILQNGWTASIPFNAHDYYSLTKGGNYFVKARISKRTYLAYESTSENVKFARIENTKWVGILESNTVYFTLVADADKDDYYYPLAYGTHLEVDCDDNDPDVHPGASEVAGNGKDDDCDPATLDAVAVAPGRIDVKAEKHTVGSGSNPGSTKEPIVGMPARVYDKSPGSCVSKFGVSWQNYKSIWLSCSPAGAGSTDNTGMARIQVAPGNYLVIGRYDPSLTPDDELYIGVSVGQVSSGQTVQKYLQVIVKADGKKVPAKYTIKTGSELLIIEPEYIEWDGTQELYPFIFESVGDWTITTSVEPPEGFVTDKNSLTAEVISELKVVQFVITDVGSKWEHTKVEHRIKHKGKTERVKSKVGIKLSEKLAKEKGLGRFGDEDHRKK